MSKLSLVLFIEIDRTKKARLSGLVEDDEEEEDAIVSIHSRLSRFKRRDAAPKGRSKSMASIIKPCLLIIVNSYS